jgi:protease-4
MNEVVNNSSITPGGGAGSPTPPTPPTPATPRVEVMPPLPPRPVPAAGSIPGGKKPGKPLSFWIALILFFGLGLSFLMNLVLLAFQGASSGLSEHPGHKYHEELLDGSGRDKIAVIEVNGVIMDFGGGLLSPGNSVVRRTIEQLRQAADDSSVKAIVLSIDSPGGGVTASDLIYHEVLKAKQAGKKIVVHMGDLCASGGYYISAPADRIVASPTTITGSIGVIMNHIDYHELLEKTLLIKEEPIKSGPHKDILSPARAMTPEERQILQGLIDSMYKRFVDLVIDGRKGHANFPADRAAVVKIADGRVYTGDEAVTLGLADATGYLEDAYQEAAKAANLSDYRVIKYSRQPSLLDVLGGNAESKVNINAGVQIDAGKLLQDLTPRLEYRWNPGP